MDKEKGSSVTTISTINLINWHKQGLNEIADNPYVNFVIATFPVSHLFPYPTVIIGTFPDMQMASNFILKDLPQTDHVIGIYSSIALEELETRHWLADDIETGEALKKNLVYSLFYIDSGHRLAEAYAIASQLRTMPEVGFAIATSDSKDNFIRTSKQRVPPHPVLALAQFADTESVGMFRANVCKINPSIRDIRIGILSGSIY